MGYGRLEGRFGAASLAYRLTLASFISIIVTGWTQVSHHLAGGLASFISIMRGAGESALMRGPGGGTSKGPLKEMVNFTFRSQ